MIPAKKSHPAMKRKLILGLLVTFMFGCTSKYKYWDIYKFNLTPNALEDQEEIKLIYTSQGPDLNQDLEYYFHLIVVSQKTGDTINVLTTTDNGFQKEEGDKVFTYFDPDNPITKLSQIDIDAMKNINHIDSINKIELKKITKVARDPAFDHIADNNFPTVIGSIGIITQNGEK